MNNRADGGVISGELRRKLILASAMVAMFSSGVAASAQSGPVTPQAASPENTALRTNSMTKTADSSSTPANLVAPKSATTMEEKSVPKNQNAGIKVHGRWSLVVRNADGTVSDRRDFENSLDLGGMFILQQLLTGQLVPGAWAISLGAEESGNTGPCSAGSTGSFQPLANNSIYSVTSTGNCTIADPNGYYYYGGPGCANIAGCSANLTMTPLLFTFVESGGVVGSVVLVPNVGVTQSGIQLTGTATALGYGTIDNVASLLTVCADTIQTNSSGPTFTAQTGMNPAATTSATDSPASCYGSHLAGSGAHQLTSLFDGSSSSAGGGSPPFTFNSFGTVFSSTVLNGATSSSSPPSPLSVAPTQTIQVTVLFTFN